MPFKKVGKNNYTGPSGKHFNKAQVALYYSLGGKFPGQKKKKKGNDAAHQAGIRRATRGKYL